MPLTIRRSAGSSRRGQRRSRRSAALALSVFVWLAPAVVALRFGLPVVAVLALVPALSALVLGALTPRLVLGTLLRRTGLVPVPEALAARMRAAGDGGLELVLLDRPEPLALAAGRRAYVSLGLMGVVDEAECEALFERLALAAAAGEAGRRGWARALDQGPLLLAALAGAGSEQGGRRARIAVPFGGPLALLAGAGEAERRLDAELGPRCSALASCLRLVSTLPPSGVAGAALGLGPLAPAAGAGGVAAYEAAALARVARLDALAGNRRHHRGQSAWQRLVADPGDDDALADEAATTHQVSGRLIGASPVPAPEAPRPAAVEVAPELLASDVPPLLWGEAPADAIAVEPAPAYDPDTEVAAEAEIEAIAMADTPADPAQAPAAQEFPQARPRRRFGRRHPEEAADEPGVTDEEQADEGEDERPRVFWRRRRSGGVADVEGLEGPADADGPGSLEIEEPAPAVAADEQEEPAMGDAEPKAATPARRHRLFGRRRDEEPPAEAHDDDHAGAIELAGLELAHEAGQPGDAAHGPARGRRRFGRRPSEAVEVPVEVPVEAETLDEPGPAADADEPAPRRRWRKRKAHMPPDGEPIMVAMDDAPVAEAEAPADEAPPREPGSFWRRRRRAAGIDEADHPAETEATEPQDLGEEAPEPAAASAPEAPVEAAPEPPAASVAEPIVEAEVPQMPVADHRDAPPALWDAEDEPAGYAPVMPDALDEVDAAPEGPRPRRWSRRRAARPVQEAADLPAEEPVAEPAPAPEPAAAESEDADPYQRLRDPIGDLLRRRRR